MTNQNSHHLPKHTNKGKENY